MIRSLTVNRKTQVDPTRTTGIRRRFFADGKRRFKVLKKNIRISIVENDCFGIAPGLLGLQPLPPRAFAFERDVTKLVNFMKWLESEEAKGILQRIYRSGTRAGVESGWTDVYIDSAYMQGIRRARIELERAGFDLSRFGPDALAQASILGSFNSPIHAEAVEMIYTRVFEDLKTVMGAMNGDIRRKMADILRTEISRGFAEGKGAETIARGIARSIFSSVDRIGINRARLITRTEIIRAHHLATIAEYRQADSELKVTVQAEFSTARDERVCPDCASLEGRVFTLDQIEGMIPLHPQCRCAAIPHVEGVTTNLAFYALYSSIRRRQRLLRQRILERQAVRAAA